MPDFQGDLMFKKHFLKDMKKGFLIAFLLTALHSGAASAAERYAITGKIANIRSGPGTRYEVLVKAEKNYPLDFIKKSGNWYEVKDFEGDVGWVHKSLLRKMSAVITVKSKCNVRAGPSTKEGIVFICERGVPFEVIKREGNWINVRHSGGYEGWIHKSLVW
jgi:SH3-like domain-containing protein